MQHFVLTIYTRFEVDTTVNMLLLPVPCAYSGKLDYSILINFRSRIAHSERISLLISNTTFPVII